MRRLKARKHPGDRTVLENFEGDLHTLDRRVGVLLTVGQRPELLLEDGDGPLVGVTGCTETFPVRAVELLLAATGATLRAGQVELHRDPLPVLGHTEDADHRLPTELLAETTDVVRADPGRLVIQHGDRDGAALPAGTVGGVEVAAVR